MDIQWAYMNDGRLPQSILWRGRLGFILTMEVRYVVERDPEEPSLSYTATILGGHDYLGPVLAKQTGFPTPTAAKRAAEDMAAAVLEDATDAVDALVRLAAHRRMGEGESPSIKDLMEALAPAIGARKASEG